MAMKVKAVLKEREFLIFHDFVLKMKGLSTLERKVMNDVISVCKLIVVNPATSASAKRSFSPACCLKIENMVSFSSGATAI